MTSTADESSDGYDLIQGTSTVTFTGRGVAPVTGSIRPGERGQCPHRNEQQQSYHRA